MKIRKLSLSKISLVLIKNKRVAGIGSRINHQSFIGYHVQGRTVSIFGYNIKNEKQKELRYFTTVKLHVEEELLLEALQCYQLILRR